MCGRFYVPEDSCIQMIRAIVERLKHRNVRVKTGDEILRGKSMDTEKTFMLHNQGFDLLFSELSADELTIAKEYVEITRHLQEIHQLYLMFQYALAKWIC